MRSFFAGFLAGAFLLILCAFGYLRLGLMDIRSDVPVPGWMSRVMYVGTHAAVRRHAPKLASLVPQSDQTLIEGGKLYLDDCVGCHGEPGKPPSEFGGSFFPPAPQFPRVGTAFSESEVFSIAKYGIRRSGMGAHGDTYTDQKLWALAEFIKRMPNLPAPVTTAIQQKN